MTRTSPLVKLAALAAPTLVFLYGVLWYIDGLDGHRGSGLAWNLGHTLFFVAFVLFGMLIIGLRRLVRHTVAWKQAVANISTVAALSGVACFLWVILGDVFARLQDTAPLPDPLKTAGPLLFQLGLLALLIRLVIARPRRLPAWCPMLVFLGFVSIGVSLSLLPIGAILIMAGFFPLAVTRRPVVQPR